MLSTSDDVVTAARTRALVMIWTILFDEGLLIYRRFGDVVCGDDVVVAGADIGFMQMALLLLG